MKAIIDPSANVYYFSFYIQGLYDVLGKKNVSFSSKYFKSLRRKEGIYAFDSNVCFVLLDKKGNIIKRIAIDFADDACNFNYSAMNWADLYFKVNINKNYNAILDGNKLIDYSKIIQIPPYMGIRVWSLWETGWYLISNFIKAFNNRPLFFIDYVRNYALQYFHRQPLSQYSKYKTAGNSNYIFFASNLWKNAEHLNRTRKKFIELCKKNPSIQFEGGFINRMGGDNISEYKDFMIPYRYSHKEYIAKLRKSIVAFNVPAVLNCHGWKIAEYFCMGKVIFSTKFYNQIPEGIKDGENILFVDENNMSEIFRNLDEEKIKKLSENSLEYWKKNACPKAVINQIINQALKTSGNNQ